MKNPIMEPIIEENSNLSSEAQFLDYDEVIKQYDKNNKLKKMNRFLIIFFIVIFLIIGALIIYNFCFT
jgi:ABC-type antimicrobial peptide transport system permease subunit